MNNIENIPADKFFAVQGKDIKLLLKTIDVLRSRDRNGIATLFQLKYDYDLDRLYSNIIDAKEVSVVTPEQMKDVAKNIDADTINKVADSLNLKPKGETL